MNTMFQQLFLLLTVFTLQVHAQNSCGDVLAADPDLSLLNGAVTGVGGIDLTNTVVFAPVNDALNATGGDATLDRITTNTLFAAQLKALLLNHAVAGADTVVEEGVVTLTGETLDVVVNGEDTVVRGFADEDVIVLETVTADDCVIHKVNGVITPSWWDLGILDLAASDIPGLKNLTTVFRELDATTLALAGSVPAVTILAPSDEAFAKLGEAVAYALLESDMVQPLLLNHLILNANVVADDFQGEVRPTLVPALVLPVTRSTSADGQEVIMIGDATVVMQDLFANNGIVHVIDQVILGAIELPVVNATTGGVAVVTPPAVTTVTTPTAAPKATAATGVPVVSPKTASPVASAPDDAEPEVREAEPVSAAGPTTSMLGFLALLFVAMVL